MKRKQKIVLWVGIGIFVLMGLFPPWAMSGQGAVAPDGYSFILNPPEKYCHINTPRLYVQWIMVTAITGGLLVTLKDKKKN